MATQTMDRGSLYVRVLGVARQTLAQIFGFALVLAGSFTILGLGLMILYGVGSPQQFALIALAGFLCWFLAYSIYQTILLYYRQRRYNDPTNNPYIPYWTFTSRNIATTMSIVTGLLFGVSVLLWFNLTIQFLVIAPFVLFFPFSYMAYSAFQRPVRIKRLRSDFELLTAQWDEELYQQSTSFFNYSLHISLATLATLLGLFIVFIPVIDLTKFPVGDIGLTTEVLR